MASPSPSNSIFVEPPTENFSYRRDGTLVVNLPSDTECLFRLPEYYRPYSSLGFLSESQRLLDDEFYSPNKSTIVEGSYFSPGDFLQSSLSKTVLEWDARVPKMDIWRTILAWAICKQEELERMNEDESQKYYILLRNWTFQGSGGERLTTLEQEIQALKLILHWVRHGGMEALKRAEGVIDDRRVKPTDMEQHIKQLLELMEKEYWRTQSPTSPRTVDLNSVNTLMSVPLRKEIFKTMLEEIPKLIGMQRRFGLLQNRTLQARFSTTFDKILRLSSWTPSNTHNKHLRKLLRNALLMLNEVGGNEQYHDDLRDFMKRHTAFCAFTLDNAYSITSEDPETTAELCRNLRRLAQNLGKIASTKAEQYQKLYENFIAHKEDLSHWLDSASPGQGRLLVDSFTDSLKDMASSMRREANFWNSQSNQFNKWPNIKQTYGCAIDAMPLFPSEQLNDDHRSSTTPSIHDSVTQNADPEPQRVPQAAQRVSATFADLLQKLRVNTTQAFLVKTENSISKRMRETRGYLEFAVEVAENQLAQPSEKCIPKVMVRLAEKALCITKRWNKLQHKVKYWGSILSIFSKPLACQSFDMASGISRDNFLERVIATPDTLNHPYVIEFELCLRDMWHHFLSRSHFWARIDSNPAAFSLAVLNEI